MSNSNDIQTIQLQLRIRKISKDTVLGKDKSLVGYNSSSALYLQLHDRLFRLIGIHGILLQQMSNYVKIIIK